MCFEFGVRSFNRVNSRMWHGPRMFILMHQLLDLPRSHWFFLSGHLEHKIIMLSSTQFLRCRSAVVLKNTNSRMVKSLLIWKSLLARNEWWYPFKSYSFPLTTPLFKMEMPKIFNSSRRFRQLQNLSKRLCLAIGVKFLFVSREQDQNLAYKQWPYIAKKTSTAFTATNLIKRFWSERIRYIVRVLLWITKCVGNIIANLLFACKWEGSFFSK